MTTPYDRACQADIERRAGSLWALMRQHQMSVDAFLAAGQTVPPPPRQLEGRIRVSADGIVEFINPADATLPAD